MDSPIRLDGKHNLEEKMRYILTLIIALFLAMPAYAAYTGPGGNSSKSGGYTGPISGALAENVADAKNLKDNARVVLTGRIVSRVAGTKDEYVFRDNTGEIVVEISQKQFRGMSIGPDDVVRISGKIDKDAGQDAEVDVKTIELVN